MSTSRILLVEENRDEADLASLLLGTLPGIEVARVEDRDQLEEALASARYDLVVTANHFSWGNGNRVLSFVRRRLPGCPVVMLTGLGDEETACEAIKDGFADYLPKTARGYVMLGKRVQSILEGGYPATGSGIIAQYQRLLELVDDAVFLATRDGFLLEVNPAFATLVNSNGTTGARGCHLADFFPNELLLRFLRELDPKGEAGSAKMPLKDGPEAVVMTACVVTQSSRLPTLLVGKLQRAKASSTSPTIAEDEASGAGQPPRPEIATVDFETVLDRVLVDLRPLLEEARTTVVRGRMPTVQANYPDIGRLFQNLLSTVVQLRTREPVEIEISAHRMPVEWLFIVKDNGSRIAEAAIEVDARSPEVQPEGFAKGLIDAQRLVEEQGGRLWTASQSGAGSTVYFTLPARNGVH